MKRAMLIALASCASGALLCLALPPAGHWFLGWFALVPVLTSVRNTRFVTGFIGGLVCVFVAAYLARSGVFYPIKAWIGTDGWLFTGFGLFGFTVSTITGLWAEKGQVGKPIWWFAAWAVVLESILLFQLPAHLALTQSQHMLLLLLASIGGIWLATFLVWLVNLGIAKFLEKPTWKGLSHLAVLLAGIYVGGVQWNLAPRDPAKGPQVGVIQTEATDRQTLERLHSEAVKKGAKLVVWPEFAGMGIAHRGDTRELEAIAKNSKGAFVTSYNDDFGPLPHNVASLFNQQGRQGSYFKRRLFGEETKMHTPGTRAETVAYRNMRIGLNICFDSCYPSIIRETASRKDVRAIALPTIDPPSPHHFVAAIHAAFTPFRAAENGITIIRADGYAYSQVVLPHGYAFPLVPPGDASEEFWMGERIDTLYSRFGDWFLYLCYGLVVFGIVKYRKRKHPQPTHEAKLEEFAEKTLVEAGS